MLRGGPWSWSSPPRPREADLHREGARRAGRSRRQGLGPGPGEAPRIPGPASSASCARQGDLPVPGLPHDHSPRCAPHRRLVAPRRDDLDNLILVCRRHHTLVHEGGLRIEAALVDTYRRWTFHLPDGRRVDEDAWGHWLDVDDLTELLARHSHDATEAEPTRIFPAHAGAGFILDERIRVRARPQRGRGPHCGVAATRSRGNASAVRTGSTRRPARSGPRGPGPGSTR